MDLLKLFQLYKSYHVMLEIIQDRGYPIDSCIIPHKTFKEFKLWSEGKPESQVKDEMEINVENKNKKLIVMWHKDPKLDTSFTNLYSEKIEKPGVQNVIIIVDVGVTPYTSGIIRSLAKGKLYTSRTGLCKKKEKVRIDIYTLKQAQKNIAKSNLVPQHIVCSNSEKKQIMSQYNVTKSQIPRLPYYDPMARHLGLARGNMVKIVGESQTQKGECVIMGYRICL